MESNDTSSTSRRDLGVAAGGNKGVHLTQAQNGNVVTDLMYGITV